MLLFTTAIGDISLILIKDVDYVSGSKSVCNCLLYDEVAACAVSSLTAEHPIFGN